MKSSLILPAIIVVLLIGASVFSISILSSTSLSAHSTFSGENSKIAFSSDKDDNSLAIYVMNSSDESEQTRLTNNPTSDSHPDWAPIPPPLPPPEPIQAFLTLNAIRDVPWGKDVIVRGKLVANASNNA
jgi:hypothetical protein